MVKVYNTYMMAMFGEQGLPDTGEFINPPPPSLKAYVFSALIL